MSRIYKIHTNQSLPDELKKHTEEEFKTVGFIYPKQQLTILSEKMLNGG
ncbi:MAG: hypothetical protein ACTHMD_11425 [Flavisolibacter sp.]